MFKKTNKQLKILQGISLGKDNALFQTHFIFYFAIYLFHQCTQFNLLETVTNGELKQCYVPNEPKNNNCCNIPL